MGFIPNYHEQNSGSKFKPPKPHSPQHPQHSQHLQHPQDPQDPHILGKYQGADQEYPDEIPKSSEFPTAESLDQ